MKRIINLIWALCMVGSCFSQLPILKDYNALLPKVVIPAPIAPDRGMRVPLDAVSLFNGNIFLNGAPRNEMVVEKTRNGIQLQDHKRKGCYRNIWVRKL